MTTTTAPCGRACKNEAGLAIHQGKCRECQGKKTGELAAKARGSNAPKLQECPGCKEEVPLLVGRGKGKTRLCPRCVRVGAEETMAPELAATAPKRGRRPARKMRSALDDAGALKPRRPRRVASEPVVAMTPTPPSPQVTLVTAGDGEMGRMEGILAGFSGLSPAGQAYVRARIGGP
ncbi:MAG: hypothetical protein ABR562_05540 [Thermoplasmatota archaeon]|nr:hypothetical protein [Halobacteriales archaeon]